MDVKMNDPVVAALNVQRQSFPQLVDYFNEFERLHEKKLWHQLTTKIEDFIEQNPTFPGDALLQLYERFITDFENRINPLSLVQIAIEIAKRFNDNQRAIAFLQTIATKVKTKPEAYILAILEAAHFKLLSLDVDGCQTAIEEAEKGLDSLVGVETIIHASFYRISADYYKAKGNYADYYKNCLLYLACLPIESVSDQEKMLRAYDLGLAAVLADSIYNFGELMSHPIFEMFSKPELQALGDLLNVFNSGLISGLDEMAAFIKTQPLLVSSLAFMRQKLCLMSLMEIVFRTPAGQRNISFEYIASEARLPVDEVEHLAMKALSLNLIKGTIDEIERVVRVTWVQPRVLNKEQVTVLRDQIDQWSNKVQENLLHMEKQTPELFIQ